MKKKRTVSETVLRNVGELQLAAAAAKKAAAEARHKDIKADDAYERKLNDLKIKIATGSYTTGDHLLDFNIVVCGSVQKDERYAAMAELERSLETHSGELAAQGYNPAGTPQIEKVGLLPSSPALQLQVGGAFGRGIVFGGDASVSVVVPVVNQEGVVCELLTPQWECSREEPHLGENIILEDRLQWIIANEPNMHLAVALWSDALNLGRPLTAPERVVHEITLRREKCILALQRSITSLRSETRSLKELQEDPRSWTRSQAKLMGHEVVVSFPDNIGQIKRARISLKRDVHDAVRLGMSKDPVSPIYQQATELLMATKEWDD